jgi:hypothetical protein
LISTTFGRNTVRVRTPIVAPPRAFTNSGFSNPAFCPQISLA